MKSERSAIFDSPVLKIILWTVAFSFIVFYLILALNNRIVSDDIYVLNNLTDQGWLQSALNFDYNKRITSHLLFNSIFVWNTDLRTLHIQLFIFHSITLAGFILSLNYLIGKIFKGILLFPIARTSSFLFAVLVLCALFFFTFQLNEVWFWTISSVIHLIPFIFIFWGAGIIMNKEVKTRHFILLFICFLFVGGSSETIALSLITIISFLIIGNFLFKWFPKYKYINQKLLTSLFATLILFSVNIFGSGTAHRIDLETITGSYTYISSLGGFLNAFIQLKNLIFIQFLVLFFLTGNLFQQKGLQLNSQIKLRILSFSLVLLLIIAATTFIPLYFVFNGLGPLRAWMPFGISLTVILLAISFYFGNILDFGFSGLLAIISAIGITTSILFYTFRQTPEVFNYSQAYDQRTDNLLQLNELGQTKAVGLPPLPESGFLIKSEIENDTNGWHNECLKKALRLNFEIYEEKGGE